jgi:Myb-like DNA-binding domain
VQEARDSLQLDLHGQSGASVESTNRPAHSHGVHCGDGAPRRKRDVAHWGAEEEQRLQEGIVAHGHSAWAAMAAAVRTRSARQCKEHYREVLRCASFLQCCCKVCVLVTLRCNAATLAALVRFISPVKHMLKDCTLHRACQGML